MVILFDNLFICSLRYLYILNVDHIQHISHKYMHQLLCILLSSMSIKDTIKKQVMNIYIDLHNHLFLPRHLTNFIILCIHPLTLVNIHHVILCVWGILVVVWTEVWIKYRWHFTGLGDKFCNRSWYWIFMLYCTFSNFCSGKLLCFFHYFTFHNIF